MDKSYLNDPRLSGANRNESLSRFAVDVPRDQRATHPGALSSTPIEELVVSFEATPPSTVTPPYEPLIESFHAQLPQALVRDSRFIEEQLGSYSAQQLWLEAIKDNQRAVLSPEVCAVVRSWHPTRLLHVSDGAGKVVNVSQKVQHLVKIMLALLARTNHPNCVIYASTPLVDGLKKLLQCALGHMSLRIEALPGEGSYKQTQSILDMFSGGLVHILIIHRSTEDIDVAPASTVIRFNASTGQLAYLWARSAVRPGGTCIHLVEAGNDSEAAAITSLAPNTWLDSWSASIRSPTSVLRPPHPLVEDLQHTSQAPVSADWIIDPVTGGLITPSDAVRVLVWLASTLSMDSDSARQPLLDYAVSGTKHVCTIRLQELLPANILSRTCSTLWEARRDACFRACTQLHNQGLLHTRFFPLVAADAEPSRINAAKVMSGAYPRKAPRFWQFRIASSSRTLYPTLVRFDREGIDSVSIPTGAAGAAVLILTRQPLPALGSFPVYNSGPSSSLQASRAILTRGASFEVDDAKLKLLHRYTLHAHRSVTNRRLVCTIDKMTYFIAPVERSFVDYRSQTGVTPLPVLQDDIIWDQVRDGSVATTVPITLDDVSTAQGYIVQERASEFAKRFFVTCIRKDLSPLSKPDPHCVSKLLVSIANLTLQEREADSVSYLESARAYSTRVDLITDHHQPLLEVEDIPNSLNAVSPYKTASVERSASKSILHLIPQLCWRLSIPARTYRAMLFIPAIMHHVNLQLLTIELNTALFSQSIREDLLLPALVSRAAVMDIDYERLEFLGDAYLKYFTSSYLVLVQPAASERILHHTRVEIVSNESLKQRAECVNLTAYIHTKPFTSSKWRPFNYDIMPDPTKSTAGAAPVADLSFDLARAASVGSSSNRGNSGDEAELRQQIGGKVVADVLEAVLGAAFLSGGDRIAIQTIRALQLPFPHIQRLEDLKRRASTALARATQSLPVGASRAVEQIFQAHFGHSGLIARALNPTLCEQLKFIGNAILDLLVAKHVFDSRKDGTPGVLTMLKSAMISKGSLAVMCVRIGLHQQLQVSPQARQCIATYASRVEAARREEMAQAEQEHRRLGQYWRNVQPPQSLPDVLEAMVAVLFINDGWQTGGSVQRFFDTTFRPFADAHIYIAALEQHPTKVLCDLVQSHGCHELTFEKQTLSKDSTTCNILIHGNILAEADARIASAAARQASAKALETLEKTPRFLDNNCHCRTRKDEGKARRAALRAMLQEFVSSDADIVHMMPS